jgi:hypothetical protein
MGIKAVEITLDNQQWLMARYNTSDLEEFPIGEVLVAEFGDNGDPRLIGVLTKANFTANYVVGEALQNGFYSVTRT